MQLSPRKHVLFLASGVNALGTLRTLHFYQQLVAVAIPDTAQALWAEVKALEDLKSLTLVRVRTGNIQRDLQEAIQKHQPEVMFVMGWSTKIDASLRKLIPKGAFNVHFGPLPAFRGPAPLFEQIRQGCTSVGVTIHQLTDELDAGPVLVERNKPLSARATYGQAEIICSQLATELCELALKIMGMGSVLPSKPQDETLARFFPKPGLDELTIQWRNMTSEAIHHLLRACNPWNKGCFTQSIQGKQLGVAVIQLDTSNPNHSPTEEAGTILAIDPQRGLRVQTCDAKTVWITTAFTPVGLFDAQGLSQLGFEVGDRFL